MTTLRDRSTTSRRQCMTAGRQQLLRLRQHADSDGTTNASAPKRNDNAINGASPTNKWSHSERRPKSICIELTGANELLLNRDPFVGRAGVGHGLDDAHVTNAVFETRTRANAAFGFHR